MGVVTAMAERTYVPDVSVWPVAEAMAACLCDELVRSRLPEVCFCGLLPGAVPSDQMGESLGGQAWVRVVRMFPSSTFPLQDNRPRISCGSELTVELELGVLRCAPMASANGTVPPTMEETWEATRLQMADAAAMRRAAVCCYDESDLVVLGQYVPYGPMGGVVGGMWTVFVSQAATPARRVGG